MKIRMTKGGVKDSKTNNMLKVGEVIDISEERARFAISIGVAEEVTEPKEEEIRTAVPEIKTKKAVRKSTKK